MSLQSKPKVTEKERLKRVKGDKIRRNRSFLTNNRLLDENTLVVPYTR